MRKVQPVRKAKAQGIGGGGLHKGGLPFQPKPCDSVAAQGQRQQGSTAATAQLGSCELFAPRLVHAFHAVCSIGRQQKGIRAKAQAALRLLKPTRKKLTGTVKGVLRLHLIPAPEKGRRQKYSDGGPLSALGCCNGGKGQPWPTPQVYSRSPSQLNRLLRRMSGTEAGGFSCIWAKKL